MTKQEWAVIAKVLADFYPHNFKLTDAGAVGNWFKALADLPGERVAAAVWSMVRTQPAFPSVADIRRLAEGQADAAAEAWSEALNLATSAGAAPEHRPYVPKGAIAVGADGKVRRLDAERGEAAPLEVPDPLLAKTIEAIGGLRVLAYGDLARLDTLRAQFLKLYAAFSAEHKRHDTFASLGVVAIPLTLSEGPTAAKQRTVVEVVHQLAANMTPTHLSQEDETP